MSAFFKKFETPFDTIPFDLIKTEDYLPSLIKAINLEKQEIQNLIDNDEKETFRNTIEALDLTGEYVGVIASVFFNLMNAKTDDELQAVAKEFSPLLTDHSNDILLNERLFSRVKKIWDAKANLNLSVEEMSLLKKKYKSFVRNGALLNKAEKTELRAIDQQLSKLTLSFGENTLKATNAYELNITNLDDLAGLPSFAVDAARITAKEKKKENTWTFTLDYPSFVAFMTYSENRVLREELFIAYASKCASENEFNNEKNVIEISKLRFKRATLLGYRTHAHFTLEERMAENPERVMNFIKDMVSHAKPVAEKEISDLQAFALKRQGPEKLMAWDYSFYAEKLKKDRFDLDDEILKPYFKLENVVGGAFKVAELLYDLKFKIRRDIPTYHKDVQVYEVQTLGGKHVGVLYADFFPRESKSNGAWMTNYREQRSTLSQDIRPHVSIVCNFTKPTDDLPSLLTFNEVKTLFHEFGHSLHSLLSQCRFQDLSGANVCWDFVELPSQILENWVEESECLDLFAKHYKTGEKIPKELIKKIKDSSNFHEGRNTLRQMSFSLIDMAWHTGDLSEVTSVKSFEEEAAKGAEVLPSVKEANWSTSFGHIFQGGYSAGYYSYKWAEVLDADAFELFKEKGIFNKEVANSFKENILSKGASEHPMTLYKRFRGAGPSPKALLKRGGLIIS
ncbi:MAG: M3 family metallopeptidase [Bacteriovoracaceae bacterium]|jgi:peptidyl-dipeptidase Dcp|nr:M3 family metallopeptidase [Bacteriovoracaceae bacterium]